MKEIQKEKVGNCLDLNDFKIMMRKFKVEDSRSYIADYGTKPTLAPLQI